MKIHIFLVAFLALGWAGCDDFLDENPDKSGNATIYHIDQLDALLSNYRIYNGGDSYTWTETLFMCDDCECSPELYKLLTFSDNAYGASIWDLSTLQSVTFQRLSWQSCYEPMFTFNTILEYADIVEQTTPEMNAMVKGEALFGRAYFHFMALVAFCRYDLESPGVGYKTDTYPNSIPARETVGYTLEKIREDLNKAEALLTQAGRTSFEHERNFRVTLPTLQAFRARLELYFGNYKEAYDAADNALKGHNTLVKFFEDDELYEIKNPLNVAVVDDNEVATGDTIRYYEMTELLSRGGEAFVMNEEYYLVHKIGLYTANRSLPISESLYNLFDRENDERWIHFYNNNYLIGKELGRSRTIKKSVLDKLKPWEYHVYLRFVPSSGSSEKNYPMGMSTPEMILIKAEYLARNGQEGDAQKLLQELRSYRFRSQEAANNIGGKVQDVLDERRRELTASMRWYDLKRLNGKENANITLTKQRISDLSDKNSTPVEVQLKPNDPLYALPIPPEEAILMGWQQNEY